MNDLPIQFNEALAPYTTIGIGGLATQFVTAKSTNELEQALEYANRENLPVLVLGGGSNMLIADAGWAGLVIKIGVVGIEVEPAADSKVRVVAGAGENWDDLVALSVDKNLQGIECLSGIPGTVGASPIQNIGAYGQEVKDTIAWVEAFDRETGQLVKFLNTECEFDYRWSRFKDADKDRYIITRVAFDLIPGGEPSLRYGDITIYFAEREIAEPSLADVRSAVIEIRRSKGMVIDSDIPDSRSCGSFFMNPIVSAEEAERVEAVGRERGLLRAEERMPRYAAGEGKAKLSAAWLMERSGLKRGQSLGNVGLSTRHILALVNRGGATSAQLLDLVEVVKAQVNQTFGVVLQAEPVFVGFEQKAKP